MKFTIAIPAYKAHYLKECIDSILAQTLSDFELIIVNDASPEDIDSIVNLYSDSRIRYYKNDKNFGAEHVVDNWNKCLSYAEGEFFVLMGDDDMLEVNYLEEFDKLIEKHPECNVYHCRSVIIDEKSEFIMLTETRPEVESVYENIWHRLFISRTQFISDFVYNTESLKKKGGFYKLPLAWASDDISSFIASTDKGVANTNHPVFKYRRHTLNISTTGNVKLKLDAILLENSWIERFLENDYTQSENDLLLKKMIVKNLSRRLVKKIIYTLQINFKCLSLKGFIQILNFRKKYKITLNMLFFALLLSTKDRLTRNL